MPLPEIHIILILCSLSIATTFALNPNLTKNYFFVNPDNRLSYELFQTPEGIIGHTIDTQPSNPISRYLNINLLMNDASLVYSDLVRDCDTPTAPTFQHLHYHVQTNSLVYFCAANTSLLIINQVYMTVLDVIPLYVMGPSWPVASLSTDGNSVAILLMDPLFSTNSRTPFLCKVNMQTKNLTAQIPLNQNLHTGEYVVAYAAGKKAAYIATNILQDQDLTTIVYSIAIIGNTYQLTTVANSTFQISLQEKIITRLFSVGDTVVVNYGSNVYFLSQQGRILQTASVRVKPLTQDGLFHPAFTAQNGDNFLYIHLEDGSVGKYTVYQTAVVLSKLPNGPFADMQVAYGHINSEDLIFTVDETQEYFKIWGQSQGGFKTTYAALAGYIDLFQTDTTYAVVQKANSTLYLFDLKDDTLINKIPMGKNNYYYDKEFKMITFTRNNSNNDCRLAHIDLVSGVTWNTLNLETQDPSCVSAVVKSSYNNNEGKQQDVALAFSDHYLIFTRGIYEVEFRTPIVQTGLTNLNMDFNLLFFYYYIPNQSSNQVNVSYYILDYESIPAKFQLQSANTISSLPVSDNIFLHMNATMTVVASNNNLITIDKLNLSSIDPFAIQNAPNYVSSFQDTLANKYALFAYADRIHEGSRPILWDSIREQFASIPVGSPDTVNGRVTGAESFALHDDLYQSISLIKYYYANASQNTKGFVSNLRPQLF